MAKTGPKTKHVASKINPNDVEKLAAMQCTTQEMAHFLDCSPDTLERNFAASIEKGRSKGKISMKRKLFEKGMAGELGAIVWWQKNFSGMSDKVEQKQEINVTTMSDAELEAIVLQAAQEIKK